MDVLKNRYTFLWISIIFFIISLILLLVPKLNLGIDMTWWIQMEYTYNNSINIDHIKNKLNLEKETYLENDEQVINNISVYWITW